ncbi:hypothetical protein C7389_11210 [Azoarcus indigens]|uniref:Uncharacterized protein n=2 Tax=Azoarcus indigens TaxID=29545 RepID=A0A4R6DWY7_9RHOO|nr:hypothetical protein C7389_11210 [Azoarcus indigens]
MGETMNRINDARAQRTGAGLYGTPRTEAQKLSDTGRPGYQDRVNAIPGPSDETLLAMRRLELSRSGARAAPQPVSNPATMGGSADRQAQAAGLTGTMGEPKPSAMDNLQNFDTTAWAKSTTQQERDAVGDTYRDAWQQQVPDGMKSAGAGALALYNMEQATRGTSITAQRGANGNMEFSGNGANALPQSYTSGVNLGEANARMAQANAVRQSYLDSFGGPSAAAIGNPTSESNASLARLAAMPSLSNSTGGGRAGRADRALALREMELAENRAARAQELGLRGQEVAGNMAARSQDAQARLEEMRARVATLPSEARMNEVRARAAASEAQLGDMRNNLLQRLERSVDPKEREALQQQLRFVQGRDIQQERYITAGGGQEVMADGSLRALPSQILNTTTGQFVTPPAGQGGSAEGRQPTPAHIDFLRQNRGNPAAIASFERNFGAGAAGRYLSS